VQVIKLGELNAYDVLCNDWIVFERGLLPTTDAPSGLADAAATVVNADPAEGARDDEPSAGEPELVERGDDPAEGARAEEEESS
jgi:hypothetical protein